VARFLTSGFFHESSCPGPQINTVAISILSKICENIRCTADINDTGGQIFLKIYSDRCDSDSQYIVGVSDSSGKVPPVSTTQTAKKIPQIYECRNWETEHYNSVLEIRRLHSFISGNT
jgi:hypothetical protein